MERNHTYDNYIRNLDGQCQVAGVYDGCPISAYLRIAQEDFYSWYDSRQNSRRSFNQRYISVKRFLNTMEQIKKHKDWKKVENNCQEALNKSLEELDNVMKEIEEYHQLFKDNNMSEQMRRKVEEHNRNAPKMTVKKEEKKESHRSCDRPMVQAINISPVFTTGDSSGRPSRPVSEGNSLLDHSKKGVEISSPIPMTIREHYGGAVKTILKWDAINKLNEEKKRPEKKYIDIVNINPAFQFLDGHTPHPSWFEWASQVEGGLSTYNFEQNDYGITFSWDPNIQGKHVFLSSVASSDLLYLS